MGMFKENMAVRETRLYVNFVYFCMPPLKSPQNIHRTQAVRKRVAWSLDLGLGIPIWGVLNFL